MSTDDLGFFDEDASYFTTRKLTTGKWIAEKLEVKSGKLTRTRLSEPSGRMHALEKFKVAVADYWNKQHRGKLNA